MKLSEALAGIKAIKPSQYSDVMLTAWVSELDGQIYDAIVSHRENPATLSAPYTVETDGNVALLVPYPYDQIYIYWLSAKIDHTNQEYDRYNNSMAMFNAYYNDYAGSYARAHRSTSAGTISI